MRTLLSIVIAVAVGSGIAYAIPESQSPLRSFTTPTNEGATRACLYASGAWTIINCSNAAAASSAALNEYSRYVVQCGDDSYIRFGTAASGQDATTNDGWLPAGAWLEVMTDSQVKFISVRNRNSDSDCRILECR